MNVKPFSIGLYIQAALIADSLRKRKKFGR
jgi:hypothetical protein